MKTVKIFYKVSNTIAEIACKPDQTILDIKKLINNKNPESVILTYNNKKIYEYTIVNSLSGDVILVIENEDSILDTTLVFVDAAEIDRRNKKSKSSNLSITLRNIQSEVTDCLKELLGDVFTDSNDVSNFISSLISRETVYRTTVLIFLAKFNFNLFVFITYVKFFELLGYLFYQLKKETTFSFDFYSKTVLCFFTSIIFINYDKIFEDDLNINKKKRAK
ncbi:hypothetical protein HERIO_2058 [Hepatospora eriocheir]|uniref:Ubiquitin-like domain-containing protein n=1 Tax=Hepatospora eriocheir TaxID=1081669 RepID=A0A1X0Q8F4_9MICR|nr:hypothetical protein HERIO_2058 [Hepatospora eriocheir]